MGGGTAAVVSINNMVGAAEEESIGRACGAALAIWVSKVGSMTEEAWIGRLGVVTEEAWISHVDDAWVLVRNFYSQKLATCGRYDTQMCVAVLSNVEIANKQ